MIQTQDHSDLRVKSKPENARIFGILPTYRRQDLLADTLNKIMRQVRAPDVLVVVDNESNAETKKIVDDFDRQRNDVDVIFMDAGENLGSAGGWALGMTEALKHSQDHDWILTLDDDDPPMWEHEISDMFSFAQMQLENTEDLGAVGIVGARFNWKTGYLVRPLDDELQGPVEVDYVGSGHSAMYRADVMREVGGFRGELFFGHTEIDFCLRLRAAGYKVIANGDLWRKRRTEAGRLGLSLKPSRKVALTWKKYYVTRNYIFLMLDFSRRDLALKRALIQTIAKPLYTLPSSPSLAFEGFRLGLKASLDGFRGNMGRTIDPAAFREFPRKNR
ncbi:glycosyltransferase family 2 protein [Rubripirellula sp.]|nr:glycosyltransferase family 2 protein [Rubripirellula sp.]